MLTPTGVTVVPERYVEEFGEPTWSNLPVIDNAVFALDAPTSIDDDGGRPYRQLGSVFVPRGSDLKDGDRVAYQNKQWRIVGDAQWDMDHPFTGDDFGYVEYRIQLGG